MTARLKQWCGRPPVERPAEVLRWVRRLGIAVAAAGLLLAAQIWATDGSPPSALIAAFGLALVSAATLGPAIRKADREGVVTDAARLELMQRRGERAAWATGTG
jgi:hypothetical protein